MSENMYEFANLRDVINGVSFRFNKALGQNFISDKNLLDAIASDSGIVSGDTVVEIGTGAGTLTRALATRAERVFSFEVDEELAKVLDITLRGADNVEVIFKDVLKMSDDDFKNIVSGRFKVVANLPYYITTPLIMRFLESDLDVESMTVMVQKEVADRLVAKAGTADYAAITLAILMKGEARITRSVSRKMFYPSPNVDSAVVRIDVCPDKLAGEDVELMRRLVRAAFAMRRKTLVNNLSAAFPISKADAADMLSGIGLSPLVRGEALTLDDFVRLSRAMAATCEK